MKNTSKETDDQSLRRPKRTPYKRLKRSWNEYECEAIEQFLSVGVSGKSDRNTS